MNPLQKGKAEHNQLRRPIRSVSTDGSSSGVRSYRREIASIREHDSLVVFAASHVRHSSTNRTGLRFAKVPHAKTSSTELWPPEELGRKLTRQAHGGEMSRWSLR
jgi:hypothetical protein